MRGTLHLQYMDCLYMNPQESIEARVKHLLSLMTLNEKIGQMTQIERSVATPSAIKHFSIGIYKICCAFIS